MSYQDTSNDLVMEDDQSRVVKLPRPRYLDSCIEGVFWFMFGGEELVMPRVLVRRMYGHGEILYY